MDEYEQARQEEYRLAALAVGLGVRQSWIDGAYVSIPSTGMVTFWNPRENDADAFRLFIGICKTIKENEDLEQLEGESVAFDATMAAMTRGDLKQVREELFKFAVQLGRRLEKK